MTMPAQNRPFTYGDYLQWDDEGRYEIIEGVVYDMTPAPSRKHQRLSMKLSTKIDGYLEGRSRCEVYAAPFDVRLPELDEGDEAVETVVQPDISVICDPSKLDERGCRGAPDWVIEIISPSTASKDFVRKLALYERHGVREYWIVDPVGEIVSVYCLTEAGRYDRPASYNKDEKVTSYAIEALAINLVEIFRD